MAVVPEDPKQVLEMALQNERQGHKILVDAGEACEDKLAKATFEFLANEELKHMDIIQKYAETGVVDFSKVTPAQVSTQEIGSEIKGIFERFGWQYQQVTSEHQARERAYETAMEMERHGHRFYAQAAASASSEDARKFYDFLAREEIRHFQILQDTHDFLEQPDAMLALEERWMQT